MSLKLFLKSKYLRSYLWEKSFTFLNYNLVLYNISLILLLFISFLLWIFSSKHHRPHKAYIYILDPHYIPKKFRYAGLSVHLCNICCEHSPGRLATSNFAETLAIPVEGYAHSSTQAENTSFLQREWKIVFLVIIHKL